jgi:hypothetical protein
MTYTPDDIERLHRAARERAQALRDEAMDELWHDLERWLQRSAHAALRASERFAHRLQHHRQLRGDPRPARRSSLLGSLSQD